MRALDALFCDVWSVWDIAKQLVRKGAEAKNTAQQRHAADGAARRRWCRALATDDAILKLVGDHQMGTCRMRDDQKTSVVKRFCRLHDAANVFVVDSSFMPTGLGLNPMVTMVANALRVGTHIVDWLKRGELPERARILRLATFNVENLFDRPKIMNLPKWSDGQPILNDYKELTTLLQQGTYSAADKKRIKKLIERYQLHDRQAKHEFMQLRDNRPKLLQSHRNGSFEIVANGRGEWVGWVELTTGSITDVALQNTGRVIAEVNPDILVLVEVDNRIALSRFNTQVVTPQLAQKGLPPYAHNMLIDGNDERGIDVGILSRFPIASMRSHIDERLPRGTKPVFARDCPEYYLDVGNGKTFALLANHFSSQGGGTTAATWRGQQAVRVRDLYQGLVGTFPNIAVLGDLNAPPTERPNVSLAPLLSNTNLQDVMTLRQYLDTTLPGTFHYCNAQDKLDYILLPPALAANVIAVGVERRGIYVAKKWKPFDTVTDATRGASDHGCLWVDLKVV